MLLLFYVTLKWLGNLPNSPSQKCNEEKVLCTHGLVLNVITKRKWTKKKSKEPAKLKKELKKHNRYFLSFSRTNGIKLSLGFPSDQKVFC